MLNLDDFTKLAAEILQLLYPNEMIALSFFAMLDENEKRKSLEKKK